MKPIERDNDKMQVVEDTIDAHSDVNVEVGGLVVGGTVACNGECEDTWLGQDLGNHLQIGNNKDANELGDHVIIQSHQFGILCLDAMLLNNDDRLPKGETGGCVINRQLEV
jgi:formylmethanofuran dehydrogenase subunit C